MTQNRIQELIENSKQGDTGAFEMLVREFQPLVFRLAFRLLCNDDDAKDMVQEVFIRVWTQLHRYKSKYRFSTWIYRITGNLCYDRMRYLKNLPEPVNIPENITEWDIRSPEDIESEVIRKELKELILFFTENLTRKQKLVFTLRDIEGLETEEIEQITGLSAKKIKSNLYLARKYIRNKIDMITSYKYQ
jgi:RNA polymerase sigma-70 factor (ECF subfamily)